MRYGLIGEKLSHSFSKEIHGMIADYEYSLKEIDECDLERFFTLRDFKAINVTIPYKERIIPLLDSIDDKAKLIGAVNTVVNRGGKLSGYNTDFYGMSALAKRIGISFEGKKVVILGTGGTSKTARAVATAHGCREVILVGRSGKGGSATYDELYSLHTDADIIINTTPVGMFPNTDASPVDISKFTGLCGVIDAVYNPLRTKLILDARAKGIPAEGGLFMLVSQAIRASEIFFDTEYPEELCERIFKKIESDKRNIVLIGMPASGKSTVGRIIAEKLGRPLLDTDTLIEKRIGMSIPDVFKNRGEAAFRDVEQAVISEASNETGAVIATGGGAILREANINALRKNGNIYFLDRPLYMLIPTSDRPLSSSKEDIERRYNERYEKYLGAADERIEAQDDAVSVAVRIIEAEQGTK